MGWKEGRDLMGTWVGGGIWTLQCPEIAGIFDDVTSKVESSTQLQRKTLSSRWQLVSEKRTGKLTKGFKEQMETKELMFLPVGLTCGI